MSERAPGMSYVLIAVAVTLIVTCGLSLLISRSDASRFQVQIPAPTAPAR